jgi:hypothetical protein
MSSSISVIEVDLDNAADALNAKGSSLLMPELMPGKLGIVKKIPSRTPAN